MMDGAAYLEASRELRGRFYSLIDSLSTLRGLASIEVRHRDERALLGEALEVLLRHQDFERCSVFLVEQGRPVLAAGRSWRDLLASGPRPVTGPSEASEDPGSVGEALMAETLRTGRLVRAASIERDPRAAATERAPVGSLVCAPILLREEAVGVVNVHRPKPNAIEPWHEHTLSLFCSVLAYMLDNNRLLRSLERAVEDRTRQLEAALREAQQLKRRYEELSHVDELSGLHNRRFFFPEAEGALARSTRYGHPFSLVLVDVDRFKHINDRFGHGAGDEVLRDVAAAISSQVREGDIIARFGGEEFVMALPNTGLDGARLLAERVRTTVAALHWTFERDALEVSVSLGVTTLGDRDGVDSKRLLETLLREADAAMYRAKSAGRDRVVFLDEHAARA